MERNRYRAVIDPERCVGCGACISHCPAGAVRMQPGWRSRVEETLCLGCGTCVPLCHRQAISLVPREV